MELRSLNFCSVSGRLPPYIGIQICVYCPLVSIETVTPLLLKVCFALYFVGPHFSFIKLRAVPEGHKVVNGGFWCRSPRSNTFDELPVKLLKFCPNHQLDLTRSGFDPRVFTAVDSCSGTMRSMCRIFLSIVESSALNRIPSWCCL